MEAIIRDLEHDGIQTQKKRRKCSPASEEKNVIDYDSHHLLQPFCLLYEDFLVAITKIQIFAQVAS